MRIFQIIHIEYSFVFCLSHVVPVYGIIFHPSIEVAPDPERDAIYDSVDALRRTAQANSVDSEWDDNVYLIATAMDIFGNADNQEISGSVSLSKLPPELRLLQRVATCPLMPMEHCCQSEHTAL